MKNKILIPFITILFLFVSNESFARMRLKSADIKSGRSIDLKHVFNDFGCIGENKSPNLLISNVPKEAQSLAITVYDPDAPTGSGWWHWIAYNIDVNTKEIATGAKEISENTVFGRNDYGTYNYGGPCPPVKSRHRYIFTLYALDVDKIDLPKDASGAMIGFYLNKHKIKTDSLTALYSRSK